MRSTHDLFDKKHSDLGCFFDLVNRVLLFFEQRGSILDSGGRIWYHVIEGSPARHYAGDSSIILYHGE